MNVILLLLVISRWSVNMVTSQGYEAEPDSCAKCEQKYTFHGSKKGIFMSPNFPDKYDDRTTCCYFFHAREDGRVKITFDIFNLESSDLRCRYDYIEISSIDVHGYKEQPRSLFCGDSTPPSYISTQSKLEIVFHSDVSSTSNGFLGHYEFLDKNWHPFPPSTVGCGPGYLTGHGGIIESPNYPSAYPVEAGCSWVIKVREEQRILITFIELDITLSTKCQDTNLLMLFDGYITPDKVPLKYCGQLDQEPDNRREYLSNTDRMVLRFQSGLNNARNMKGMQLSWTAITMTTPGTCSGFECTRIGTSICDRTSDLDLCKNHHFCIDKSLECNEVPNCGATDSSDENKCLLYVMRYVGYIGGPILALIITTVTVVCCYRRFCRNDVKYSVPKEQSLPGSVSTQSSNVPVRSLEHSPRSSCIMYTTSFTDRAIDDSCQANSANASNNGRAVSPTFTNSHTLPLPKSSIPKESGSSDDDKVKYQCHQKRDSYHMMRELCYEGGNIVIADI